jgi:hypothetical protein
MGGERLENSTKKNAQPVIDWASGCSVEMSIGVFHLEKRGRNPVSISVLNRRQISRLCRSILKAKDWGAWHSGRLSQHLTKRKGSLDYWFSLFHLLH